MPDGGPLAGGAMLQPGVLENSGAVIGEVFIENGSIFDLDDPEENGFLYRLANRVHVETRKDVIRQQLLFDKGDTWSSREVDESERILRGNRYIQDARIRPVNLDDGIVDLVVETQDVWTLVPRVSASRAGGTNSTGIGLKEMNLFGTGIEVETLYKSNVDRDSLILRFADRHLGDSWYSLSGAYGANSDGHQAALDFELPFYALDSKKAHGVSLVSNDEISHLYDEGEIGASFRHETRRYQLSKGWSDGLNNGWARRYTLGLGYDEHVFSDVDYGDGFLRAAPADRRLAYPFVELELLQDRFEKTRNLDLVSQTEDRYLGSRLAASVGYAGKWLGSDRNAWLIRVDAQTGFGDAGTQFLLLGADLDTRIEHGDASNLSIGLSARYYRRQSERRLFYASLSGSLGHALDVDRVVELGGDNGLRGYPLRYQGGDKYALLTLEQRFFTDWYPFHLFRVGAAVFMDVGRAWGKTAVAYHDRGVLRDVGFGLRIGNPRSGAGRMTHIDLAYPLDGGAGIRDVQLVVETRKSF